MAISHRLPSSSAVVLVVHRRRPSVCQKSALPHFTRYIRKFPPQNLSAIYPLQHAHSRTSAVYCNRSCLFVCGWVGGWLAGCHCNLLGKSDYRWYVAGLHERWSSVLVNHVSYIRTGWVLLRTDVRTATRRRC